MEQLETVSIDFEIIYVFSFYSRIKEGSSINKSVEWARESDLIFTKLRIKWLRGCLAALSPSSSKIICIHIDGLISGMTTKIHPIPFLCSCNNISSYSNSGFYEYLKSLGIGLSSKECGFSMVCLRYPRCRDL